jgi:hypothetical protein
MPLRKFGEYRYLWPHGGARPAPRAGRARRHTGAAAQRQANQAADERVRAPLHARQRAANAAALPVSGDPRARPAPPAAPGPPPTDAHRRPLRSYRRVSGAAALASLPGVPPVVDFFDDDCRASGCFRAQKGAKQPFSLAREDGGSARRDATILFDFYFYLISSYTIYI